MPDNTNMGGDPLPFAGQQVPGTPQPLKLGGLAALVAAVVSMPHRQREQQINQQLRAIDSQIYSPGATPQTLNTLLTSLNDAELKKSIPKELLEARKGVIQGTLQQMQNFQQTLAAFNAGKQSADNTRNFLTQSAAIGPGQLGEAESIIKAEDPQAVASITAMGGIEKERITQQGEYAKQGLANQGKIQAANIAAGAQVQKANIEAGSHIAVARINERAGQERVNLAGKWAMKRTALAGEIASGKLTAKSVQSMTKGLATQSANHTKALNTTAKSLMPAINAAMARATDPMTVDEAMQEVNTGNSGIAQIAAFDPSMIADPTISTAQKQLNLTLQANLNSIMIFNPDTGKVELASKFFDSKGNLKPGMDKTAAGQNAVQQMKTIKASILGSMFDPTTGRPIGTFGDNASLWANIHSTPSFVGGDDSLTNAAATTPDSPEPANSPDAPAPSDGDN